MKKFGLFCAAIIVVLVGGILAKNSRDIPPERREEIEGFVRNLAGASIEFFSGIKRDIRGMQN